MSDQETIKTLQAQVIALEGRLREDNAQQKFRMAMLVKLIVDIYGALVSNANKGPDSKDFAESVQNISKAIDELFKEFDGA